MIVVTGLIGYGKIKIYQTAFTYQRCTNSSAK